MTTMKFSPEAFVKIGKELIRPMKNSLGFMKKLGTQIDRDTKLIFKNEGGLSPYGFHKWKAFGKGKGVQVYRSPSGKWAKRSGTDKSKSRRYSNKSKLLQASGSFKKSFGKMGIWQVSAKKMKYGTNHKLAEYIMSNPARQVLKFNQRRYTAVSDLFYNWVNKGIRL